jgi:hypothetical protein
MSEISFSYYIESMLEKSKFKGFPIVTTKLDQTLVGYITRSELKYAISKKTWAFIASWNHLISVMCRRGKGKVQGPP